MKKKKKVTIHQNCENIAQIETYEVILVHFNVIHNTYQRDWRVLTVGR